MDIVLVGFICAFIFGGWLTGFLRRVIGLAFIAISFVLGVYLRGPVGDLIHATVKDLPATYAELWATLLIFPVALVALHLVAGRLLKNVAVKGLSRGLDGTLGAAFGAAEAILIVAVLVILVDTYATKAAASEITASRPLHQAIEGISTSTTAGLLRQTVIPPMLTVVSPLLPSDLTTVLHGIPGLGPGGVPGLPTLPGLSTPKP
jgi:uncharacterized membrane protein required for colicin V production